MSDVMIRQKNDWQLFRTNDCSCKFYIYLYPFSIKLEFFNLSKLQCRQSIKEVRKWINK